MLSSALRSLKSDIGGVDRVHIKGKFNFHIVIFEILVAKRFIEAMQINIIAMMIKWIIEWGKQ